MQVVESRSLIEAAKAIVARFVGEIFPTTHFVSLAQAILYRGAGFGIVWPEFLALIGIGSVFFMLALGRFRKTITTMAWFRIVSSIHNLC